MKMKFKDAPIGARFTFIGDDAPKDVYVKVNSYGTGLVVKWNGNVKGHQSHCSWVDETNGYNFDTEINLLPDTKSYPISGEEDTDLFSIEEVKGVPHFRRMKVENGYLYNFFNVETKKFNQEWIAMFNK